MLVHPEFDPVALALGPLQIRWYGLSYLVGFGLFLWLTMRRVQRPQYVQAGWVRRDAEDLLFWGVLGAILGGRLGYTLLYKPGYYLANPLEILKVWEGGMAFHGGLIGVILALLWYARSRQRPALQVLDVVTPAVPIGLACGRMGNFINGELWGRAADASLPWAMVFPQSGTAIARHPSQLYQVALEGLLLFVLMQLYARRDRPQGQVAAAFLFGYGVLRFVAEYFREPDSFLGLLALNMSMGQWLCVPMILGGAAMWWWCGQQAAVPGAVPAVVPAGASASVRRRKK
jgi:phosphatidylglycerol:prolipoprotein diacylglycerol transferase